MSLPQISATGNLTQDIELRFTTNGKPVGTAKLACNDRKLEAGKWIDGETCYLTVTIWGTAAENAVQTVNKGDTVSVTGKLTQRKYTTKDGQEKTVYEVVADSIAAELRRTPYLKAGIKRQPANEPDAWSLPLSDNNTGVNF